MISHRFLAVLIITALSMPAAAWAFDDDEMVFGVDDVEEEFDDDDDAMMFAPDDLDDSGFDPESDIQEALDVGVLAVPGDAISDDERSRLQSAPRDAARQIPEITTYGDSSLLPDMIDRDPDYCSREALCLASIGRSAGVQRILQARVEQVDGRYRLDLDYFDVEDRLFVAYHSSSNHRSFNALLEAVPESVNYIFGIRSRPGEDDYVDDRDVNIPRVLAYGSAGLGVAFLATGGFFGLRVNSQQEELDQMPRNDDGQFTEWTQREAQTFQREMEANARYANIFMVVGGVLSVGSVLLFVFGPDGSDVEAEARLGDEDQPWYSGIDISPHFSNDGMGFGASWRF